MSHSDEFREALATEVTEDTENVVDFTNKFVFAKIKLI